MVEEQAHIVQAALELLRSALILDAKVTRYFIVLLVVEEATVGLEGGVEGVVGLLAGAAVTNLALIRKNIFILITSGILSFSVRLGLLDVGIRMSIVGTYNINILSLF